MGLCEYEGDAVPCDECDVSVISSETFENKMWCHCKSVKCEYLLSVVSLCAAMMCKDGVSLP